MTAEIYGFESTPEQSASEMISRPTEPALELVHDAAKAELLELTGEVYAQFSHAFEWPDSLTDELFARVAGSDEELSDALGEKMIDLYITGLGSAFVQDESRAKYKFIFEKFTRGRQDVASICTLAVEEQIADREVDEEYVSRHLLATLSKMSMHQE